MQTTLEPVRPEMIKRSSSSDRPSQTEHIRSQGPVRRLTEFEKVTRLYVVGGLFTAIIGSAAIAVYGVSVPEAAAASAVWLIVTYVTGRTVVQLMNAYAPREAKVVTTSLAVVCAAIAIIVGVICLFFAFTLSATAAIYQLIPLPWAIRPVGILALVTAGIGLLLMVTAVASFVLSSGILSALLAVVEQQLLTLAIFLGVCGGSNRSIHLAHIRSH